MVPPKSNRLEPWQYDKALYRKRNEVERLFRRLKGFRRIFSRFDKLAVLFLGFLNFALIVEALRSVNTPWGRLTAETKEALRGLATSQTRRRLLQESRTQRYLSNGGRAGPGVAFVRTCCTGPQW